MKAVDYIKKGWIRYLLAANSQNKVVNPRDPEACYWCSVGAILAAYHTNTDRRNTYKKLEKVIGTKDIIKWNDDSNRTKEEVIKAFEEANI